MYQFL